METTYKKNILLTVTGMSPAVVTETLYALVVEKGIIPTEIQVITTVHGKNKLLESLLGIVAGRKERQESVIDQFIQDYGEKYGFNHIHFDENSITVIEDKDGNPLNDIRTVEENQLAANQITQRVGELCSDEEVAVHVSIAGGRKTMGFFVGYALSLYGRQQDTLSHVLVDEAFENVRDFYYPKPYSHLINDIKGRTIDCKDAKLSLADIPWVRLGQGIPENLRNQKITYSDAVKNTQKWLDEGLSMRFIGLAEERIVEFNGIEVKLSPREYAFLYSLAYATKNGWTFSVDSNYEQSVTETYSIILEYVGGQIDNLNGQTETYCNTTSVEDLDEVIKKIITNLRGATTELRKKLQKYCQISPEKAKEFLPMTNFKKYEDYHFYFNPELTIDTTQVDKELSKVLKN